MNATMYIPCSITLTEREYLLVQQLAHTMAPSDYAFSAAVRKIIREWEQQSAVEDNHQSNLKAEG